jgi:hypothetical protein
MKAKIIWKFNNKARVLTADGKIHHLDHNAIKQLCPALFQGCTGTLQRNAKGIVKFIMDAEDVDLTPVQYPPTIRTPSNNLPILYVPSISYNS